MLSTYHRKADWLNPAVLSSHSCRQCGSRSFRADRSLAGRLVCTRCGAPQGQGGGSTAFRRGSKQRGGRWPFWVWLLLAMFVVVVVLPLLVG
ncbi:MAG: transcriptional regulator [Synechococcus sp. ARS1019]|nr:transcriptional regulator [Synechococcus sp. ARS1019]